MKSLYTAIVDGRVVGTWNHVGLAKKDADFDLQYCNGYSAWILKGNRIYAHRKHGDEKWEAIRGKANDLAKWRDEYYKRIAEDGAEIEGR